ncbi:transcription regulator HTH, apses-type DNA-binding domain-containing protein [Flagelloscypha sp. PMI_526]|nr:transcription regulator HTH, apses-type DNA-binding domain-containing protein [Flagelloscypha sp. PMI_526]
MANSPTPSTSQALSPPPPSPLTSLKGGGSDYRPFASSRHNVVKGRYITSNDPRGPVYEYPLNGQWIMMDIDDGYILWTGIWKALGNSKADIVKMVDSHPNLSSVIRRVRGGYLKIQGTWMPYENALDLARRVGWPIREDLVPLFGPTFPSTCLSPEQPGYGQVITPKTRRRARRTQPIVTTIGPGQHPTSSKLESPTYSSARRNLVRSWAETTSSPFAPPLPSPTTHCIHKHSWNLAHPLKPHLPVDSHHTLSPYHGIHYRDFLYRPPIRLSPTTPTTPPPPYALPSLAAMEDLRGVGCLDSATVLQRLKADDDDYPILPGHLKPIGRPNSVQYDSIIYRAESQLT